MSDGPLVAIHQPEFMPWPGFIHKLVLSEVFVLLDTVQFRKNYFQNRNRIATPRGPSWITVPVSRPSSRSLIREVLLCNDRPWPERIDNQVTENYRGAPYADTVWPPLRDVLHAGHTHLADLNAAVIRCLMGLLDLERRVVAASELGLPPIHGGTDVTLQICRRLRASRYLSGRFGREYLDTGRYREAGIEVLFQEFTVPEYPQQQQGFLAGMSVLDMLMNLGPSTLEVLMAAQQTEQMVP